MPQDICTYYRFCPDQPSVLISDAVCQGRQRVNYPSCSHCPFSDKHTTAASNPAKSDRRRAQPPAADAPPPPAGTPDPQP